MCVCVCVSKKVENKYLGEETRRNYELVEAPDSLMLLKQKYAEIRKKQKVTGPIIERFVNIVAELESFLLF